MAKRSRRKLVTQADLARHLGVTPAAISLAVRRGDVVPEPSGLIDLAQAQATFGRRRALRASERAKNRSAVARHERATLTKAVASVQMLRRKAQRLNDRLIERDALQVEISALATDALAMVRDAGQAKRLDAITRDCIEVVASDLGDLCAEALRVLQGDADR